MTGTGNFIRAFFIILSILIFSCNNTNKQIAEPDNFSPLNTKYAKGFNLFEKDSLKKMEVYNPWQKAEDAVFQYYLVNKNKKRNFRKNEINVPVNRVICLSTTHLGYIEKLGFEEKVVGASGINYINSEKYKKLVSQNKLADVGYEQSLDYELIISLKPDVVFAYSVGSENTGFIEKFAAFNIPVVFIAGYLERHPLGRAEWIKAFGMFFNAYATTDSIFNIIEKEYNFTKAVAENSKNKPKVMTGLLWSDSWYVPGGNSYFANFIKDAGGKYIWDDNELSRSLPLSIEKVLMDSQQADIWINTGNIHSIGEIIQLDEKLGHIKPLKNKQVYNNNAIENEFGGNDFWESGAVNPHIILKDLASVFNPGLFSDYQLTYYKKIE